MVAFDYFGLLLIVRVVFYFLFVCYMFEDETAYIFRLIYPLIIRQVICLIAARHLLFQRKYANS